MSIESVMITRARPHIIGAKLRDIIRHEIGKGCRPEISPQPVALEAIFQPIWAIKDSQFLQNHIHWSTQNPIASKDLTRLRVWISPEQKFDWIRSERFIKQLQTTSFRVGIEIAGNNKRIIMDLLSHHTDIPIVIAAFRGEFEFCELTVMEKGILDNVIREQWSDTAFRDFFPSSPYSHLLTRPQELQSSPLVPLINTISTIEDPAVGFYQVLFQAVHPGHNWHRNVEILLDIEYAAKLQDGFHSLQRYAQQSPSGDLRQMSWEVESKANNDKYFYSMAFRIAVIGAGEERSTILSALSASSSLFQHGGRPLGYLTEKEYAEILSPGKIRDMFLLGLTYRPGFLVNTLELTGPVNIPPLNNFKQNSIPMEGLETLPVRNPDLLSGTWIGTCNYAGKIQKVHLPVYIKRKHTHFIGATGVGKSTTMEHMIMEDIIRGHGVAVLDPHGDMIERLLCLIPESQVERTIYFNPGDSEWVPIWNPLERVPGQDIGRTANDLVEAIKSFVATGGWGDRLANILRNMIFSILHISGGTFLDIYNLLRNKSKKNQPLFKEILRLVDNQPVRGFWQHDYKAYGKNDLNPAINKLSKLLVSGTVSLMLSQPENRFNFRKIMDERKILLVDLSNMAIAVRQVLGCFILTTIHQHALNRRDIPIDEREQFDVYSDESHNFLTDSIENFIAETRKYRVSLNLAHQYLSQFNQKKRDALSTVGTSIIFKVDKRDADYLSKDLQGKVKPNDLVSLERGEAFGRIGTDVVKIETRPPLKIPETHFRNRIIEESRRQYYRPAYEVKKWIRQRGNRWSKAFIPLVSARPEDESGHSKELVYDEF